MRRPLIFVPVLTILLLSPLAAAHDVPSETRFGAAQRDFSQRHLVIRLRPDLLTGRIGGRVELRFEALVDGFRLLRLHAKDMQIHTVRAPDGGFLGYVHENGVLRISLDEAIDAGEEGAATIEYTAAPTRGLFFHRPTEAHPKVPLLMYSQGQGADNRRWIPCYDHPDDRLTWDLFVEVPRELKTVSNGVLLEQETVAGGLRRDHWHMGDRAPTYLISLVVGDLMTLTETWKDVTLECAAPGGCAKESELKRALALTPDMLTFFSTFTGRRYPWPRYAQTFVWDFVYGGMENVTATTLNMRALHDEAARPTYRSDALVAHELAHMWFGDLLTCRTWKHLWLNEGFATYFTDLFFEHHFGQEEFLDRRRAQNIAYLKGTPKPHELPIDANPRGDIPLELAGLKAYNRGAAILHMLRREIGDSAFQKGVKAWVSQHADQAVVTEQLRRVFEEVSGRDLSWFFDQWVYGSGYPVIEVEWGNDGTLVVRQIQPKSATQGLFRMTIPVRWGREETARQLHVYKAEHRFPIGPGLDGSIPMPENLSPGSNWIRFNVGGDILMRAEVTQSPASWQGMLAGCADLTGRMDAALALEAFGEAAVPALGTALGDDPSWAVRRTCAEVLGRLGGATAVLALRPATDDADARVRVAACEALAKTRRDLSGSTMAAVAADDPNPYVRAAAARAVGKLKVPGARRLLELMLAVDSHVDVVRQGALDGLRALGDPAAVEAALPYLGYEWGKGATHKVRRAALDCVTALGPDRRDVHARLIALLEDPYHRMRQWAAVACGTYGVGAAIPALEALERDWNGGVRGAAHAALQRLGAQSK